MTDIPDEVFADAHLAAAAEVHTGTEWHAPINAAVRAALNTYLTTHQVTGTADGQAPAAPGDVADERLLAMLADLPSTLYAAAEQHGDIAGGDETRKAFNAGCYLVIEAVTEWLATHTVLQLPGTTVTGHGEIVVEVNGGDEAVAGYRDADGQLLIETSQPTWNDATAVQVALGILAGAALVSHRPRRCAVTRHSNWAAVNPVWHARRRRVRRRARQATPLPPAVEVTSPTAAAWAPPAGLPAAALVAASATSSTVPVPPTVPSRPSEELS